MEQEQKQRRDNPIDRLNNAYSSYQNARLLLNLGRSAAGVASKAAPLLANPYVLIGILVVVIIFVFIIVLTGGPGAPGSPGSQTGGTPTSPSSPAFSGLNYTIPFRDTTVGPVDSDGIKKQVLALWPNAKIQNWETIVGQSINNGWNPAFVLALWIEETGAQGATSYTDPLDCDPSHPTTDITISLRCLFNNFSSYTNDKFADFMCRYSESKNSPCDFLTNPNFPKNIKSWYSQLVPAGNGSLVNQPINPPAPNTQTLRGDIKNQFGIEFANTFSSQLLTWAWEILWASKTAAPNFLDLVHASNQNKTLFIETTSGVGYRGGGTIYFSDKDGGPLKSSEQFFKQNFIHELAHVIHGARGNSIYDNRLEQIINNGEGYLTAYSAGSTNDPSRVCDQSANPNDLVIISTRVDEDFAESVSYFINRNISEQSYSYQQCPAIKNPGHNPFQTGKYPNHLSFIQSLLSGTSF